MLAAVLVLGGVPGRRASYWGEGVHSCIAAAAAHPVSIQWFFESSESQRKKKNSCSFAEKQTADLA